MYDSDERMTALLVKLNKLTSMGKLVWHRATPPAAIARGADQHISTFATATYRDTRFGIFQQRYQSYDGERDRFYWSERVVLAILDAQGNVLWELANNSPALADLFDKVRSKVAGVDKILDALLSEEEDT
jgi:hypothetical protein